MDRPRYRNCSGRYAARAVEPARRRRSQPAPPRPAAKIAVTHHGSGTGVKLSTMRLPDRVSENSVGLAKLDGTIWTGPVFVPVWSRLPYTNGSVPTGVPSSLNADAWPI